MVDEIFKIAAFDGETGRTGVAGVRHWREPALSYLCRTSVPWLT